LRKLDLKVSRLNLRACALARHRHDLLLARTVHGAASLNLMASESYLPCKSLQADTETKLHMDAIAGFRMALVNHAPLLLGVLSIASLRAKFAMTFENFGFSNPLTHTKE
jgi:hypothetical protein